MMDEKPNTNRRIASLDQFRGYTVVGMIAVNFLGGFTVVPAILKHHNTYCSYADTIMSQFFFAVGFAYRLTFLKRLSTVGPMEASVAVVRRNLGLILVGFVIYHLDGKMETWAQLKALGLWGFLKTALWREVFQALVHIGVTSLWVLPVIGGSVRTRVVFMSVSAFLHVGFSGGLVPGWSWYPRGIDGGPLGFLTWTIPVIVGSLAFDAVMARSRESRDESYQPSYRAVVTMFGWSVVLMVIGYGFSCLGGALVPPPFMPPRGPVDLWAMSQRTGAISYQTFAAGFSLAVYAFFVLICDHARLEVGLFRTFGKNALAAYIVHGLVAGAVKPWVPKDAPEWYVLSGILVYFGINYLFMRDLEAKGLFLKL